MEDVNQDVQSEMQAQLEAAESKLKETISPDMQVEEDTVVSERPEWLPEKFKSAEDLAKAYGELEKKMSDPSDSTVQTDITEGLTEEKTEEVAEVKTEESVEKPTESLIAKYSDEWMKSGGQLSEKTVNEISKSHNLSPEDVQAVASMFVQQSQAEVTAMVESVGGQEQFDTIKSWARDNLSDEEIAQYNTALGSGQKETMSMALKALSAQYKEANGSDSKLLQGKSVSDSMDGTYPTMEEAMADIANPKYKTSAAFRKKVEEKMARSNF